MDNEERLSGALQENILTLLCFDDKNCKIVRAAITPQLFGNAVHREVAGHAIDFIDQYGETIKEHLADHLEDILKGEDARKASTYERLLKNLYESRDTVNGDYVVSQLHKFVRQQNLKSSVIRAVECLEDGRIDDAEIELQKGLNTQSVAFEAGLSLNNADDVGAILDNPEEEGFTLGIPELDDRGLFPRRKEICVFLAARGMGKSWFVTHCCKRASIQGWSAVVITLEMGEKPYGARMLQSFFSISRREAEVTVSRFERDRKGGLADIIRETMQRMTMKDGDIKSKLMSRIRTMFERKAPLRIKAFPTGTLTMSQLEAYLDGLQRFENFTPDLLCIDYPDLMDLPSDNLRIALGQVIQKIRGLAVKRNMAAVIVTQGNREAEKATTVTTDQVAEDISKLATADLLFTYSQTAAEYALGLARLMVGKARNESGKFSVLLTQAYALGQFCLDSVLLKSDYWGILDENDDNDTGRPKRYRADEDESEPPPRSRKAPAKPSGRRRGD